MATLYDSAFRKGDKASRSLLKAKIKTEFNLTDEEAEQWLNKANNTYNSNV
jgi:hypothetical protein